MGCGLKVDEKPQFASFRFYETNSDLMFETSAKNFNQMFQSSSKFKMLLNVDQYFGQIKGSGKIGWFKSHYIVQLFGQIDLPVTQ